MVHFQSRLWPNHHPCLFDSLTTQSHMLQYLYPQYSREIGKKVQECQIFFPCHFGILGLCPAAERTARRQATDSPLDQKMLDKLLQDFNMSSHSSPDKRWLPFLEVLKNLQIQQRLDRPTLLLMGIPRGSPTCKSPILQPILLCTLPVALQGLDPLFSVVLLVVKSPLQATSGVAPTYCRRHHSIPWKLKTGTSSSCKYHDLWKEYTASSRG